MLLSILFFLSLGLATLDSDSLGTASSNSTIMPGDSSSAGQAMATEPVISFKPSDGLSLANPPPDQPAAQHAGNANHPAAPAVGLPEPTPDAGTERQHVPPALLVAALALSIRALGSKSGRGNWRRTDWRRLQSAKQQRMAEAVREVAWLLDDSWRNDIGQKELRRGRSVMIGLGSDITAGFAQLSEVQLETWIRETRGWWGGFPYNEGSDHLRFLAASVTPAQAKTFFSDFLFYLDDAPLANKVAVYGAATGPSFRLAASRTLAADPHRAGILNQLAGTESISPLVSGVQFYKSSLLDLVDPAGLEIPAQAEVLLASSEALSGWGPSQTVPATASVSALADGLHPAVVTYIRQYHSPQSHQLSPLFEHLVFADDDAFSQMLSQVTGDPETYAKRFNDPDLAADMGLVMGVAADAVSRNAGRRSNETEALVRLGKSILSATGAPVAIGVGGSWILDETKSLVGSSIGGEADALRKELYFLAIPPLDGVDPEALAAYQTAFYGVQP